MTKADRGLSRQDVRKYYMNDFERVSRWLIAGLVILTVTGVSNRKGACAQTTNSAVIGAQKISDDARATATALFGDRCAVCHGANGDGKGPGASNLNPKPVDFRNPKWQRSVSNEKIAKAIVYGGPAVGLSAAMAANPDLEAQPSVVAALVEHIRGLASKQKP
jgi:mono/diheme cytochrome c family protein